MRSLRRSGSITVLIFIVMTGLVTTLIGIVISDARFQTTETYHAIFTDISGMEEGVDVRVAGVTVGKVQDLDLRDDGDLVRVTFTIPPSIQLTERTRADIRYKNLIGDRYLDLTEGKRGENSAQAEPLGPGGTIPVARTAPALDLDELFNGFKPLMRGLSPKEVNELSSSLIAVFQGQSGKINSLLSTIASLTSTLADRDQVIGAVIENLNQVFGTLDRRRNEFSSLIDNLQKVISGLSADRETIGKSVTEIGNLAGKVGNFVEALRPEFRGATMQIKRVTSTLNTMPEYISYNLSLIPRVIQLTGRGGSYGSFFNLYLCSVRLRLDGPTGPIYTPMLLSDVPRCKFPDGKVFH